MNTIRLKIRSPRKANTIIKMSTPITPLAQALRRKRNQKLMMEFINKVMTI